LISDCITLLSLLALLFFSFFAVFKTNQLMRFYVKLHQKWYLNSLKKSFFLSKYYQALTKYNYEYYKRQSRKKWVYYNTKICGVFAMLLSLFMLFAIINYAFLK
jgi:hypothetical protein